MRARLVAVVMLAGVMGGVGMRPLAGQGAATAATPVKRPIDVMAWVVGGVWTADVSKLGPAMRGIETRYFWADNGAYLRFATHFVTDKGTLKNYDGSFYWDPAQKTLRVWYMDAKGTVTQGPVTADAALWQMFFQGTDFEGKQADLRVEVAVKSNDLYHWTLSEKAGEGWKKLLELDYARRAG